MPKEKDLPSTLQKSPAKAQRTFQETLESAEEQYGKGERASRTAYASLKHNFEKVGDHWEPKDEKGPSDPRSKQSSTCGKQAGKGETYGGVNAEGHTKDELRSMAKKAGLEVKSSMTKADLARELQTANDRATAKNR